MIFSLLYVPVKGIIGDKSPESVYGYYPIWELIQFEPSSRDSSPDIPITLGLNVTAWVLQLAFITLVFLSLLLRALKHFREH